MARKLSANYVVFALEPCIRSEQYSQLGIEKIVEKICGVATSIGQKRIVSVDQNDRGVVVKFGHEFEGMQGNAFEYICSIHLQNLAQQGLISEDDLNLFAMSELDNFSPLVIRQEYGYEFTKDPDFQRWLKETHPQNEDRPWMFVSEYIFDTPRLRDDANRIQQILHDFFIASDVHVMQEPKNFALRYVQNGSRTEKRLMLIDMDSCFPILVDDQGREIRPVCPLCSNPMEYVPNVMKAGMDINALKSQSGVYSCTRPSCANYVYDDIENNGGYTTDYNSIRDNNVFRRYIEEENQFDVNYLIALYCYSYIPADPVFNIVQYKNAVANELGPEILEAWGQEGIYYAYRNFANAMIGHYLSRNNDETTAVANKLIKSNYDFAGFVDEIQNYVYARVENDPFTLKLIASLYIITLAGEDVITVFDMLNAQDANELLQAGKGILYDSDIQNVSTMFAWLHQGELVR